MEYQQLLGLVIEYERSLPARLRHGAEPDSSVVRERYAGPNAAFIATDEDRTVGCIAAMQLDSARAVLQRLYVRPAARGRGFARALVDAAIAFCRDEGYERIVLDTERKQLPAAYELYVSMGFTPCAAFAEVGYDDPTFMQLRL